MANSTDNMATLKRLLVERSVRRGSFVLASGKQSDIYVDARLTTMSPEGMLVIGPLGLSAISDHGWMPDSIGGLTMGADPVAFAISHTSAIQQTPVRAFSVRKEAKAHGTGNRIFRDIRRARLTRNTLRDDRSRPSGVHASSRDV
jgi:orotate phosphoribosyltransferase